MKRYLLFFMFAVASLALFAQEVNDNDTCVIEQAFVEDFSDLNMNHDFGRDVRKYRRQFKAWKACGWAFLGATVLYIGYLDFYFEVGNYMRSYLTGGDEHLSDHISDQIFYIPVCSALAVSTTCFILSYRKRLKWKRAKLQMSFGSLRSGAGIQSAPALCLRVTF